MSFFVVTENKAVAPHDDECAVVSNAYDDDHVYEDEFSSAACDDLRVEHDYYRVEHEDELAVVSTVYDDYHVYLYEFDNAALGGYCVEQEGSEVARGARDDYHVDEDGIEARLGKIPSAFRFSPTDEQLMVYYLCNKVSDQPLPPNLMEEVTNFYNYSPDTLTEIYKGYQKLRGDWYFFTPIYHNTEETEYRYAGDGYWRLDTEMPALMVYSKKDGEELGWKKTFHYYKGTHGDGLKTNFVMHEYTCLERFMMLEHWVLCSLHLKKKPARSMSNSSLASTTELSSSDSENVAMEEDW